MVQEISSPGVLEDYGPGSLTPEMPSKVAVIGAGVSGLSCARRLRKHRIRVHVFEKSRGPGGRSSTRRTNHFQFDHGAQYFTVRDPQFGRAVADWTASGAAAVWKGRMAVLNSGEVRAMEDDDVVRYVGVPGMSAVTRRLAGDLRIGTGVRVKRIEARTSGYRLWAADTELGDFDAVVLSVPAPQAAELLAVRPELQARVAGVEMRPTWAVLLGYETPMDLPFDGAFVHESPLSWAARNVSKPGREGGEAWILHGSHEWSAEHLELDPEHVLELLQRAWRDVTDRTLPEPVFRTAHRWRYAAPVEPLEEPCLVSAGGRLGVCGDWCGGPRLEGAYLSGRALADQLLEFWS